MEALLRVEHLKKQFHRNSDGTYVLKDISFEMMPGECLGLIGNSGSGKSTIVKILTGITTATKGCIYLEGKQISGKRTQKEIGKKVQMIFQNPVSSFDPRKSLGHGIGESLRNSGVPKEEAKKRVLELLGQCGLPKEFYDRYPHEVSGGQCQRAAIARALAVKPKIVICDEATSALDVTVQQQIMELLDSFRKEHQISYLFICHNLALVQQFCDRVLVMKDGRIVEEGTPDEVILNPRDEYTKMLVESVF